MSTEQIQQIMDAARAGGLTGVLALVALVLGCVVVILKHLREASALETVIKAKDAVISIKEATIEDLRTRLNNEERLSSPELFEKLVNQKTKSEELVGKIESQSAQNEKLKTEIAELKKQLAKENVSPAVTAAVDHIEYSASTMANTYSATAETLRELAEDRVRNPLYQAILRATLNGRSRPVAKSDDGPADPTRESM